MKPTNRDASYERKQLLKGLAFCLPWLIGFLAFTLLPVAMSAYYSLCDYTLLQPPVYRGLENYRMMLSNGDFWKTLWNTLYYAALALPTAMVIAIAVSLLLNVKIRGQSIYRTIIFLPSLAPAVASCMLWLWLFNAQLGLINIVLMKLGIRHPPTWLGDKHWAMPALVLMSFWGVGNTVVIYLAGLQDVPRELYEAADLDGASVLGKIFNVTLPMISPVIFFNLIMALIGTVQTFTAAFIMTGGGPERSTLFLTLYLYQQAFQNLHMGYASAIAWAQLLLVLALTAIAFASSKKWVHYQGK